MRAACLCVWRCLGSVLQPLWFCSLDLSLFQIAESQDKKLCYNGELLGEKQSL